MLADLFRLGFGARQLAQFAHGHAFVNQQWNSNNGTSSERDDPKHDRDGRGRLLSTPKIFVKPMKLAI